MSMLQERMNKLFEESLARSRTAEQDSPMGTWMPSVDIYETDDRVVLKADLPGVRQGEIDLKIEDSTLMAASSAPSGFPAPLTRARCRQPTRTECWK
jgi:HSP20 family molecular chaperone IbpA